MRRFAQYISQLETLAVEGVTDSLVLAPALNGEPSAQLRRSVDLATLREHGAFFTGHELAKVALRPLTDLDEHSVILDPACGAGDLLIRVAAHLPVQRTLTATLRRWGRQLRGIDVVPEFVRATRCRLALAALAAGAVRGNFRLSALPRLLPGIQQGDGLAVGGEYASATHVVMNPPFTTMHPREDPIWRRGTTSGAALFLAFCLENIGQRTRVVGILPEVLRTGSTYEHWRRFVCERTSRLRCTSRGRFSRWGDVDVFTFDLTADSSHRQDHRWGHPRGRGETRIEDRFDVRVGPVVPHRHRDAGEEYAYVHARSVPPWKEMKRINERRGFEGRSFEPPLVVVRRTSRPGDKYRAVPTLIQGARPIAIENHLLVLLPHRRSLAECRRLMRLLRDTRTNSWLDSKICCRHLTVGALSQMPWWKDE